MNENTKELIDEMQILGELLDTALEYGLEVEVIYWALKYMKEHPEVSPLEAFASGVAEWVK